MGYRETRQALRDLTDHSPCLAVTRDWAGVFAIVVVVVVVLVYKCAASQRVISPSGGVNQMTWTTCMSRTIHTFVWGKWTTFPLSHPPCTVTDADYVFLSYVFVFVIILQMYGNVVCVLWGNESVWSSDDYSFPLSLFSLFCRWRMVI